MPGNDSGKELVNGLVTRESVSVNHWVGTLRLNGLRDQVRGEGVIG